MAKDYLKVIEKTAQETAQQVVLEIKTKGLLKDNRHTAFKKTETLLYNYINFKSAIEEKYKHIKYLQDHGLDAKSKSITSFSQNTNYKKDTEELVEEKINSIRQSIAITSNLVNVIDSALSMLKNDKYYDVICYKYFEKRTYDEIAEIFDVDRTTISRNKNRLINILKVYLFSDDVIKELFS